MIIDLAEAAPAALPDCDVCIVGSGPAGLTVANELAGSGLKIVVLESGRRRPGPLGDALRKVESRGIAIKDYSRERVLGGASTTWAGLSAPFDEIDFAHRPWVEHATPWPLPRAELLALHAEAAARYRFAPLELFGPDGFFDVRHRGETVPAWGALEEKVFLAASEPQDWGREWSAACERDGCDLLLDATVLRLQADAPPAGGETRRVVRSAVLRTSAGRELQLRARAFVLATGGLQNARLLLLSRDGAAPALGNEHDQVGRYLMNHPKNYFGIIELARPVRELPWLFGCLWRGWAGYAGLRLSEAEQVRRRVLNSYVRFEPLFPWSDSRGVEALVLLAKRSRGLSGAFRKARAGRLVSLRDYSETGDDSALQNERRSAWGRLALLGPILKQFPTVLRYVVSRLREGRAPPIARIRLRNFMEMEPHPDNRVRLGEALDVFGQPVTLVSHAPTALDRRSMVAVHEALDEALQRSGWGRLRGALASCEPWPIDQDASHHMGTTRMGDDPRRSVVDGQLRVHSVENLWCAGASVLPTSGCANPTLTLVALSIRLARHLRGEVFGRPAAARAGAAGGAERAAARAAAIARLVPPAGEAASGVIVIGAGERVTSTVLPVLDALADRWRLEGLFARKARTLRVDGVERRVEALETLDSARLARARLVYVAVSKAAVPEVLAALRRRGAGRVELLVDTPVLLLRHLHHARCLADFRAAWAAEDCFTLPWFDVVRAASAAGGPLGALREVLLDRSGWRYHALAMQRALLGERILAARRTPHEGGTRVVTRHAGGARGTILEPRDYASGHVVLRGERATASDAPERVPGALHLRAVLEGEVCVGFALGELSTRLHPVESALLGAWRQGERVTAHMEGLKAVGLWRLLADLHAGRGGYPVERGLDDMAIDTLLEKTGRGLTGPLTSLRAPVGRRLLPLLARLLP